MTNGPHHATPDFGRKRNKFGAVKTTVDGHTFDSKAEARRYGQLKLLVQGQVISGLQLQPKFTLTSHGAKICTYRADFEYVEKGARVVEDVKSVITAKKTDYRLRIKLFKANFPDVDFREVLM